MHEYFVSLFIRGELKFELFVDVTQEEADEISILITNSMDWQKAAIVKAQDITGYTLEFGEMALVQDVLGRYPISQFERAYNIVGNIDWVFRHFLFGDEYMKLVS